MRAIFCSLNSLLRDSHLEPGNLSAGSRLVPATLEAMRLLATEDSLVFLFGAAQPDGETRNQETRAEIGPELVRQIEAGGGRVDGLLLCHHDQDAHSCRCWGEFPGIVWTPASELRLDLSHGYLLADDARDIATAYAAGIRPMTVLSERSIEQMLGNRPDHKDFPIVRDLITAVRYIDQEEEARGYLGHPRVAPVALPSPETLYEHPAALPRLTILSRSARDRQAQVAKSRVQLRDMGRWLGFFSLGAIGLSLGIAYLLTHLYRLQPFPPVVYYVTLQFIPRPVRGALFILWGVGVILLAIRSFYRSTGRWRGPEGDDTA